MQQVRSRCFPISQRNGFFSPRMVGTTGPLHIIWNAFESACKGASLLEEHERFLRAILHILGSKTQRQRFLDKCLADKKLHTHFDGWKHAAVDWKWEYMEDMYNRLSSTIDSFFKLFDSSKMMASSSQDRHSLASAARLVRTVQTQIQLSVAYHMFACSDKCLSNCRCLLCSRGTQDGTVDGSRDTHAHLAVLVQSMADHARICCDTEFFAVFGRAVGKEARWFGGCAFHELDLEAEVITG